MASRRDRDDDEREERGSKRGKGGGKGEKGASIRPSTFRGGGLLDDVDVRWKDPHFTSEAPEGYSSDSDSLFFMVTLVQADGTETDQHWSAGKLEYFEPSKDGGRAIPVGDKQDMSSSTNFAELMNSLIEAGFDEADLPEDDIRELDGLEVHMVRKAQPKRSGLKNREDDDDSRPRTVLVVSELLKTPDEKGTKLGKGKGGGKAKGKGRDRDDDREERSSRRSKRDEDDEDEKPRSRRGRDDDEEEDDRDSKRGRGRSRDDEEDDEDEEEERPRGKSGKSGKGKSRDDEEDEEDDLDGELFDIVAGIVDKEDDDIEKTDLVQMVHRATLKNKNAKAMVKRVYDDEFLEAGAKKKLWAYDEKNETVSPR